MGMLATQAVIKCGEGRTKQKVGLEHDINKIIASYKKTGQLPVEADNQGIFTDVTTVGDFHKCQNIIAHASERFQNLPSVVRRRFNNSVEDYLNFVDNIDETTLPEAIKLGLVKQPEPQAAIATANKTTKEEGKNNDNIPNT